VEHTVRPSTAVIGVLVPDLAPMAPPLPESLPFGRAALRLAAQGIDVVFGGHADAGRLIGRSARPGGWTSTALRDVCAALDRFPTRTRPAERAALGVGLGTAIPVANLPALVALCSDKIATQRLLSRAGVRMPDVEDDPDRFQEALTRWGSAFLKPRFGAFGRGIRKVREGDALPAAVEGAVPGHPEPSFLQRAVEPPEGWAGVCARVLVQRRPDGGWHVDPPVARCSRVDPVVNAARGADVKPLGELVPQAVAERAIELARCCAEVLANEPGGALWLEAGVDVAIDRENEAWVLEVNGTPRGRLDVLRALDPSFDDAHVESCARPLRVLAALYG
jgi:glutathione synthase/RimK-type ligase-like ATP-grasp enzyme